MKAQHQEPIRDLLQNCSDMLEGTASEMRALERTLLNITSCNGACTAPIELQRLDELTQTVSIIAKALQLAIGSATGPAPDISELRPVHLADLIAGRATSTNHADIELF